MKEYIIEKVKSIFIVLVGISLLSFLLGVVSPGDPAELSLSKYGYSPTPQEIEVRRVEMGLDKPIHIQYINWVKNVLKGDFGKSFSTKENVTDMIIRKAPVTFKLAIYSIVITSVFGISLGVIAGINKNKPIDNLIKLITNILFSLPTFWLALLFILVFSEKLGILPTSGDGGFKYMIMPAVSLSLITMSTTAMVMRSSMIQEFGKHYYTFAKAKGISKYDLYIKNVLPNAILPVLTILGNFFGSILGGSAVVETIFALSGIGSYAVESVFLKDFPYLQAYVLLTGLAFVLVTSLVDILIILINPKIRLKGDIYE